MGPNGLTYSGPDVWTVYHDDILPCALIALSIQVLIYECCIKMRLMAGNGFHTSLIAIIFHLCLVPLRSFVSDYAVCSACWVLSLSDCHVSHRKDPHVIWPTYISVIWVYLLNPISHTQWEWTPPEYHYFNLTFYFTRVSCLFSTDIVYDWAIIQRHGGATARNVKLNEHQSFGDNVVLVQSKATILLLCDHRKLI